MLKVEGLTKWFGGVSALEKCSFTVSENTITAIVGPNGSGKTTLFDIVNGFISADVGRVYFRDRDISGLPPHAVARLGIARTFQLIRLYRELSVIDNLLLARWSSSIPLLIKTLISYSSNLSLENRLIAEMRQLIEKVGLIDKRFSMAGELSFGQQKVLEIIRAILADPILFLFDEPAAGLDSSIKLTVTNLIRGLKAQKKTVILIEHDLGFVRDLCDEVVVLDQGAPIFIGRPESLAGDPYVKERYLSRGAYL
jgi:ABC-type branched-subunit amino acid transport system ATPase component